MALPLTPPDAATPVPRSSTRARFTAPPADPMDRNGQDSIKTPIPDPPAMLKRASHWALTSSLTLRSPDRARAEGHVRVHRAGAARTSPSRRLLRARHQKHSQPQQARPRPRT
eukprot:2891038-Alexandrium_andersonii.AAC.1